MATYNIIKMPYKDIEKRKECNLKKNKTYRENHADEIKARAKIYRDANREKINEAKRLYRLENKEEYNKQQRERRALKKAKMENNVTM